MQTTTNTLRLDAIVVELTQASERRRRERLTATIYSDTQGEVPARTWRQDVEEWARAITPKTIRQLQERAK